MILYDQGKLKLDDPLSKYLPAFANMRVLDKYHDGDTTYTTVPAVKEITIKDLLQHTAGLDYPQIGGSFLSRLYNKSAIPAFYSDSDILRDKVNQLAKYPLLLQPGTAFNYSYSVDVLGAVIEKISGISLDKFFHQYIFEPLKMNDTYFYLPKEKASRLVSVYSPDGSGRHVAEWKKGTPGLDMNYPLLKGTYYAGGAGLVSKAEDYFTFLQMLLNDGEYDGVRILKKETVQLMTTDQLGDKSSGYLGENKWGLGFMIVTDKGAAPTFLPSGSYTWAGAFGSYYWVDPVNKIVGVLFLNLSPFVADEVRTSFKKLVYAAINN
jgi:CubicO group peptidase (beta-lactamase class C family)